jgi:hypothetical protein
MNSYILSRKWFDWCFENPEKINPSHSALYFFCIEQCNRLGWKEKFGLPSSMAKEALGIRSYNTYIKTLNDMIEFGFITIIEKSKNQYSSNIIALSNFNKATNKALDKALINHVTKQSESTHQSIYTIYKQQTTNNKQQTIILPEVKKLRADCKRFFIELYEKKKSTGYYWTAKDGAHLAPLLKKIESKVKEKHGEDYTTQNIYEGFSVILENINDVWILDNLSIPIVNSKFNEIFTQIKNGKSNSKDKYESSQFREQ